MYQTLRDIWQKVHESLVVRRVFKWVPKDNDGGPFHLVCLNMHCDEHGMAVFRGVAQKLAARPQDWPLALRIGRR